MGLRKSLTKKVKGTKASPETGRKVCATRSDQRKSRGDTITLPRTSPIQFGKRGITLPGTTTSSTSTRPQEFDIEAKPSASAPEQSITHTSSDSPTKASVEEPSSITSDDEWLNSTRVSGGTDFDENSECLEEMQDSEKDIDSTDLGDAAPALPKKRFLTNPVREKGAHIQTQKKLDHIKATTQKLEREKVLGKEILSYLLAQREQAWSDRDQWVDTYNIVVAAHNQKHDENQRNLDLIDAAYQALKVTREDLEGEK